MKRRYIVGAIIYSENNEIFLAKMPKNRGVYPDQWGLVGGGIDEDETVVEALRRVIKEETGLAVQKAEQLWFFDETKEKLYEDGSSEDVYMVYLMHDVWVEGDVVLNEEWEMYEWVSTDAVGKYDLNEATQFSFEKKGWL